MKEHITARQPVCRLFDGTIQENVAMGLDRAVGKEEIVEVLSCLDA
jgi:hypothetical protein